MTHFMTGVFDSIEEKCRATMLHENMDISHLIVYAQQIEDTRHRKKISDARGKGPMMEVLPRVNLKFKIS